jgi:hypothetical protein
VGTRPKNRSAAVLVSIVEERAMLQNAVKLEHHELRARDGKIGHVQDFFFGDRQWTVRYLVVDTGSWLASRKVLISPVAVQVVNHDDKVISVDLTQAQVRDSPTIDSEQPVSREHEAALTSYYDWPAYWGAAGFPDTGFATPVVPMVPIDIAGAGGIDDPILAGDRTKNADPAGATRAEGHHLRSVRAVTGHTIEAIDGSIGHVDDFLIDDASWEIRYLVVDTRNWWPGKKVVITPDMIHSVGWNEAKVRLGVTRAAVKASPPYDPEKGLTPDYAGHLRDHYARTGHHEG